MKYSRELKDKLQKLVVDKPLNFGQCCGSKRFKSLADEVLSAVPLLSSDNFNFCTRIFWILNDIYDFPKCAICGKPVTGNVKTFKTGYNKAKLWEKIDVLSVACSNPECIAQLKQHRYEATCRERYGVDNAWQSPTAKAKILSTNTSRYGNANPGNRPEGRDKAKTTWIKNLGVENPLKSATVQDKIKNTYLSKYGVSHYTKSLSYHLSAQRNNLSKCIAKLKSEDDPEIDFIDIDYDISHAGITTVSDLCQTKFHMHCKRCNFDFCGTLNMNNYYKFGTYSSCPSCRPSFSASSYEREIGEFISSECHVDIIQNSRQIIPPYEIDIFIPSKQIAIEFDGLYWHSTKCEINPSYHIVKTELCFGKGIQLIHIFENEWKYKQDIVKGRIKNLLGIHDTTIYARSCSVSEVQSRISRDFQVSNHLQGAVLAKVNLGLFSKGELVSLMTFGKCRFDKRHEWELLRFCNKVGYHIPGAAGKLLKHFEKNYNPMSLVSYADRRWSQGKVYEALGFVMLHKSSPNYWYIVNGKLESRIKYQKHKLKDILPTFDEKLTEVENMEKNGIYRIFDCGNLVYEKSYLI